MREGKTGGSGVGAEFKALNLGRRLGHRSGTAAEREGRGRRASGLCRDRLGRQAAVEGMPLPLSGLSALQWAAPPFPQAAGLLDVLGAIRSPPQFPQGCRRRCSGFPFSQPTPAGRATASS